jgi:hypothetical protein
VIAVTGEITRERSGRRVRVVAAAAGVVVLIGAGASLALRGNGSGGSDPGPTAGGTTSQSTSSTDSPSPSESERPRVPALPRAATEPTRPGASAFLKHFFAVYNYSFLTLNTGPLLAISSGDCAFCASAVRTIEEVKSKGSIVRGGEVSVVTAVAQPGDPEGRGIVVNSVLQQAAGQTVGVDGSLRETVSPTQRRLDALVRWEGSGWRLVGVDTATG